MARMVKEKFEEFDTIKLALPEDDEEEDEDEDGEDGEGEGGEDEEGEEGETEEDKTEDDKFIKEKGKVKDKENNKVNNKLKRTVPVSSLKNGNVKRKRKIRKTTK